MRIHLPFDALEDELEYCLDCGHYHDFDPSECLARRKWWGAVVAAIENLVREITYAEAYDENEERTKGKFLPFANPEGATEVSGESRNRNPNRMDP